MDFFATENEAFLSKNTFFLLGRDCFREFGTGAGLENISTETGIFQLILELVQLGNLFGKAKWNIAK